MNEEELRAQHPDLYAAIFNAGREAGASAALALERDRVQAHLHMGKESGDMDTAHAAILDGSQMTQTLTATYVMAASNRADRVARQQETEEAAGAVDGAQAKPETQDLGDQVMALVKARDEGIDINA